MATNIKISIHHSSIRSLDERVWPTLKGKPSQTSTGKAWGTFHRLAHFTPFTHEKETGQ